MNRRDFINTSAAGVGALLLGMGPREGAAKAAVVFDPGGIPEDERPDGVRTWALVMSHG